MVPPDFGSAAPGSPGAGHGGGVEVGEVRPVADLQLAVVVL